MELRPIVKAALDNHAIEYEVIDCDPELADTAAFCETYGYKSEESANTIVVTSKKVEPPVYCVCVVLAPDKLDVNATVRKKMGVKKASFADAETTKELTGMMIGGVTAPGITSLPIYVDSKVLQCDQIIMGGGNRSTKILLSPKELQKLPNVKIVEGLSKSV